jgi:hypothetical protein
VAGAADLITVDLDFLLYAKNSFFEGQIYLVLQVLTPVWHIAGTLLSTPESADAEELLEDIGEITEIHIEVRRSPCARNPCVPIAVVCRPFLRIGQDCERFIDFFKALFRVRRFVHVGMVLAG